MDPNPIKHFGSFMKELRARIEPILSECGFETPGVLVRVIDVHRSWIDYIHNGGILAVTYERHDATLSAEWLSTDGGYAEVARTPMNQPRSIVQIAERIDTFASEVRRFAQSLVGPV